MLNQESTMKPLDSPVLLIIFNRPNETATTMSCIRKQRPRHLFVAADGPRHQRDKQACQAARLLATDVDWPCEVRTLFRDHNVGCGRGVSEAISWFFEHVEQGIILEDDCVPSAAFFDFCNRLLPLYQHNEKVMMITGTNFVAEHSAALDASYYFSSISNVWGWATWRRAWRLYDYHMSAYPEFRQHNKMREIFDSVALQKKYYEIFDRYTSQARVDTWDYQWQFTLMHHQGLSVVPKTNLVTNIGFGLDATHTKRIGKYSYIPARTMPDELVHPAQIQKNENLEVLYYQQILSVSMLERVKGILKYCKKIISDTLNPSPTPSLDNK